MEGFSLLENIWTSDWFIWITQSLGVDVWMWVGSREALSCLFYLFLSPLRDIGSSNKSQCASNQMQGNTRQGGNCWAGGLDYKVHIIQKSTKPFMNSVAILSFWYFVQKNVKSLQQSKYKNLLPKYNKLNHNLAIILDLDEETSDHIVMVVDYCIESPLFCSTTQVVWGREPKAVHGSQQSIRWTLHRVYRHHVPTDCGK